MSLGRRLRRLVRKPGRSVSRGPLDPPEYDLAALEREDRRGFFRRAFFSLVFNEISGDYAEFGCWTGTTFTLAFQESRRVLDEIGRWGRTPKTRCRLWAFDSFEGLPPASGPEDEHPRWVPGDLRTGIDDFHRLLRERGIPRSEYEVVPGYYEQTLVESPATTVRLPEDICLAYVDCDLYSSTMAVFRFLAPRLKHGMIIALDDYYCYSSTQVSGERRACAEVFGTHPRWRLVPYIQYGWHGMSFVVERRQPDDALYSFH